MTLDQNGPNHHKSVINIFHDFLCLMFVAALNSACTAGISNDTRQKEILDNSMIHLTIKYV